VLNINSFGVEKDDTSYAKTFFLPPSFREAIILADVIG